MQAVARHDVGLVTEDAGGALLHIHQFKKTELALGIEIISEASRHLTDDIKARQPQIPWSKVAGIGSVRAV
jgi:uncharacterized protein with HEPN domain